jgi:hypothetical protein
MGFPPQIVGTETDPQLAFTIKSVMARDPRKCGSSVRNQKGNEVS